MGSFLTPVDPTGVFLQGKTFYLPTENVWTNEDVLPNVGMEEWNDNTVFRVVAWHVIRVGSQHPIWFTEPTKSDP